MIRQITTFSLLLSATTLTFATDTTSLNYNVVDIQASASRLVANDEMSAVLSIEKTDKQPAVLANQINELMNQGLTIAKKYPQVQIKTGPQSTYPIYDNDSRKIKNWRGNAELQIKSNDFKATSQFISELQQNFQTQSIRFSVSDEKRKMVENELLTEASKNFQQRANTLTQAWHKTNYDLVHLDINTNQNSAPRIEHAMFLSMKAASSDAIAEQEVSSGDTKISVSANGSIQLK